MGLSSDYLKVFVNVASVKIFSRLPSARMQKFLIMPKFPLQLFRVIRGTSENPIFDYPFGWK